MPMKQAGRVTYKTLQGKMIDMDMLRQKNELTPAVGNIKVNARGDELGTGGKIVRRREEVLKEYYESQDGMPDEAAVRRQPDIAKVEEEMAGPAKPRRNKKVEDPLVVESPAPADENWVEDADGNFVQKDA
jgi:hypothetical protein